MCACQTFVHRSGAIMYRILVYFYLIYTVTSLPQSIYPRPPVLGNSSNPSPKNEVEIFAPLYPPGRFIPNPKPLPQPPAKPTNPPKPLYPPATNTPKQPYPPTTNSQQPIWTTQKPLPATKIPSFYPYPPTTKIPSFYPYPPTRKPPNFPPPVYPSWMGFPAIKRSSSQPPSTIPSTTETFIIPSTTKKNTTPHPTTPRNNTTPKRRRTKIPQITSATIPSPQTTIPSKIPPRTTSSQFIPTTIINSRTTVTPAWIYPPRPSWPRRPSVHPVTPQQHADIVAEADTITEKYSPMNGLITEYQGYNEQDGSFQLGFQLENGLSAKVHGFMKDGKHILEGSYSLFTQDGKPVNVVYKADDSNSDSKYVDADPTIFHLDIPINLNFDDENNDPTLLPHSGRIINVADSEDGQFSDLILQPTTEHDIEIRSTTEQIQS